MVEFHLLTFPRFPLRKKEDKSYFGKNRTHDFRTGKIMESLGLQAILDSAPGVTCISERLLKRLRKYFDGVDLAAEVWAVPGIGGRRPRS